MTRHLLGAALCGLACASPALAQYDLPGGTYVGKTNQARGEVRFVLNRSETRISKFVFEWRALKCGDRRNAARGKTSARGLRVRGNRFVKSGARTRRLRATETFGGGSQIERYRVVGRLLANDRARGTIRVSVSVRNRFGTVIDTCSMSRTARWTATRTGVSIPE